MCYISLMKKKYNAAHASTDAMHSRLAHDERLAHFNAIRANT